MMDHNLWWLLGIGFMAQILFASRMVVQWVCSEKAGYSVSPTLFWQLSLLGSILFLIYGILRADFAIVLGQVLVYYIYIRNLQLQNKWIIIPMFFRLVVIVLPVLVFGYLLTHSSVSLSVLLNNENIPLPLKILGSAGQVIFTLRFYFQWIHSEIRKESVMSHGFWVVSALGSSMIFIYAIFRRDPVLLIGQLSGLLIYLRNLTMKSARLIKKYKI